VTNFEVTSKTYLLKKFVSRVARVYSVTSDYKGIIASTELLLELLKISIIRN